MKKYFWRSKKERKRERDKVREIERDRKREREREKERKRKSERKREIKNAESVHFSLIQRGGEIKITFYSKQQKRQKL